MSSCTATGPAAAAHVHHRHLVGPSPAPARYHQAYRQPPHKDGVGVAQCLLYLIPCHVAAPARQPAPADQGTCSRCMWRRSRSRCRVQPQRPPRAGWHGSLTAAIEQAGCEHAQLSSSLTSGIEAHSLGISCEDSSSSYILHTHHRQRLGRSHPALDQTRQAQAPLATVAP